MKSEHLPLAKLYRAADCLDRLAALIDNHSLSSLAPLLITIAEDVADVADNLANLVGHGNHNQDSRS